MSREGFGWLGSELGFLRPGYGDNLRGDVIFSRGDIVICRPIEDEIIIRDRSHIILKPRKGAQKSRVAYFICERFLMQEPRENLEKCGTRYNVQLYHFYSSVSGVFQESNDEK